MREKDRNIIFRHLFRKALKSAATYMQSVWEWIAVYTEADDPAGISQR